MCYRSHPLTLFWVFGAWDTGEKKEGWEKIVGTNYCGIMQKFLLEYFRVNWLLWIRQQWRLHAAFVLFNPEHILSSGKRTNWRTR